MVKALERESTRWTLHDGTGLANVYTAWGASLSALSRRADAERVLRLGVSVAPLYTIPTIALATLLVDDNRRKDADAVLDAFVSRLLAAPNLDDYGLLTVADFYRAHGDLAKALASYLKAYKKTEVTNQFLYENLASLYEQLGNDAEAIRIDEQLLILFEDGIAVRDVHHEHAGRADPPAREETSVASDLLQRRNARAWRGLTD